MRTLVESLQRLYSHKRVTLEKIEEMKSNNKITEEEYEFIIAE